MKAREKFIARLKELGLYEEWDKTVDRVGKVMDDDSIVILIHYEHDDKDPYNEIHYPPFEQLWKSEAFRRECKYNFYDSEDHAFVAELAYWLDIHCNGAHCPLYPVDVYFPASGMETEIITFEDDADEDGDGKLIDYLERVIKDSAEVFGKEVTAKITVGKLVREF